MKKLPVRLFRTFVILPILLPIMLAATLVSQISLIIGVHIMGSIQYVRDVWGAESDL